MQFEWYVPKDEHSHHYIVTWGKRVTDHVQAEEFYREMDAVWKDLVVHKFNNEDVIAREAMERFYAEEDGWNEELLYRPDLVITEWRKLAARHNRGIQRKPSVKPRI
jgi:carbazole 1,9a-dioxygenase terminal dioxygenase component